MKDDCVPDIDGLKQEMLTRSNKDNKVVGEQAKNKHVLLARWKGSLVAKDLAGRWIRASSAVRLLDKASGGGAFAVASCSRSRKVPCLRS